MKEITQIELKEILADHKLWLETNEKKGACADLRKADLREADLRWADLTGAVLTGADFRTD